MSTRNTMQETSLAAPPHTRDCLLASTSPSTEAAYNDNEQTRSLQ